jgi:hypothetical protein
MKMRKAANKVLIDLCMFYPLFLIMFIPLITLLGVTDFSYARVITDDISVTGPELGSVEVSPHPIVTPAPNNDNTTGSSINNIHINTTFDHSAPIDITFDILGSGGDTEYFFEQWVANNTTETWADYHFKLMVPEVSITILRYPDFDIHGQDPAPTSSVFTNLVHTYNELSWSGGIVSPGETVFFSFSIDVPDDTGGSIGHSDFTLRQYPTVVPEPISSILFIIGGATLGFRKWRKKRSA